MQRLIQVTRVCVRVLMCMADTIHHQTAMQNNLKLLPHRKKPGQSGAHKCSTVSTPANQNLRMFNNVPSMPIYQTQ